MKSNTILFTGHRDLAGSFFEQAKHAGVEILHLPLEVFRYRIDPDEEQQVTNRLDTFRFVLFGNLRNARHFFRWADKRNHLSALRQKISLVTDQATAGFLEDYRIPAIMPKTDAKPIDIIEFMLRISQQGESLYPTTDRKAEEIPGLLEELELPVTEFQVCREETIPAERLQEYQARLKASPPKAVLFHNRSSVIRIRTAFPFLDFTKMICFSGGRSVSEKMKEEGLNPDAEGGRTGDSLTEMLSDFSP